MIVLTKTDLVDPDHLKILTKELKKLKKKTVSVSIHDYQSLEDLKKVLNNIFKT